MPSEFAHAMRSAELALAMKLLPPHGRILELGAGDGWQASMLAQHGFTVSAVDVANPPPGAMQYTPVTIYDGVTLPFADHTVDAVFSSNVLEHVKDFDRIQAELARVLKPGGVAVHCVPTAVWRFWTTVGHPLYALRWVVSSRDLAGASPGAQPTRRAGLRDTSVVGLLRLGLIAPRHGELGNLLSEHYLFSRRGWKHRFEQTGWLITSVQATHLFYTGNEILGLHMPKNLRVRLASVLGSSTDVFAVHRPPLTGARTDVAAQP